MNGYDEFKEQKFNMRADGCIAAITGAIIWIMALCLLIGWLAMEVGR